MAPTSFVQPRRTCGAIANLASAWPGYQIDIDIGSSLSASPKRKAFCGLIAAQAVDLDDFFTFDIEKIGAPGEALSIRETSSRSSINFAWLRAARSMALTLSRPLSRSSSSQSRTLGNNVIERRGFLSSCETVARKLSLARLSSSALSECAANCRLAWMISCKPQ